MRFFKPNNNSQLAKLHYLANDYVVVRQGGYVVCAVTGKSIPLTDLRYWSTEHQVAYADAEVAYVSHVNRRSSALSPS